MLNLPPYIIAVAANFAPLFSRPTYIKFLQLATGYLLCRGRTTISNALRMVGLKDDRGYPKYYDIFRRASWSQFKASRILLGLIDKEFLCGKTVRIIVDTTLERRRGNKIFGLGMHRDAARSTKEKKAFATGHNWLVVCILIKFPGTKVYWSLPFLSILLKPAKPLASSKNRLDLTPGRRHKKVTKYTEQVIHLLRRWLGPNRKIELLGDAAFCTRPICRACQRRNVALIARFRLDASLFAPPPPPTKRRGRRRIVGDRLPNLKQVMADPSTIWKRYKIPWYGDKYHEVDVTSGTALWYHNSSGKPVPVRWVLSGDRDNPEDIIAILCTDLDYEPAKIVSTFVHRWTIETTFQEVRLHMGYEGTFTWADKGIERVAPTVMASYSIVCLIASQATKALGDKISPQTAAWYEKQHITFSDVHLYVKSLIINYNIFTHPGKYTRVRNKTIRTILQWAMAA